jgi:hypothetical protein
MLFLLLMLFMFFVVSDAYHVTVTDAVVLDALASDAAASEVDVDVGDGDVVANATAA